MTEQFVQYRCWVCKKLWRRSTPRLFSCTVLHGEGDCCHMFEEEVHARPS